MKSVDKIAKNLLAQLNAHQTSTMTLNSTPKEALPPSWVAKIFARMQARYTHMWVSALPTSELRVLAMEDWAEELAGLTAEQIKHGFDSLDSDFPPSPAKFKQLCLGKKDKAHNTAAYLANFTEQRITRKDRKIEQKFGKDYGREQLRKAREMLRGGR